VSIGVRTGHVLRVHFFGVRGSTPAFGSDFAGVGGNTSCVALGRDGEPWSLVLDAGTGLSAFSRLLDGEPFVGSILLGHLHLDHTQGLPFFPAGDRPDARVQLIVPEQGVDALELMSRCFGPPHFPITLDEMLGDWTFSTITAGEHRIEGFDVTAADVVHPGGRSMGYRVSDGVTSVVYISDHATSAAGGTASVEVAIELARDADVLIHDSQFTEAEQLELSHYGHSTPQTALHIAERAGVSTLVLFHHAPTRTDPNVERLASALSSDSVRIVLGREGLELQLP